MRKLMLSVSVIMFFGIADVACAQVGLPLIGGAATVVASSVTVTSVSISGAVSPTEPDPAKRVSWTGDGLFTATAAAGATLNINYEIDVRYSHLLTTVGSASGNAVLSATPNSTVTKTYSLTSSGQGPAGFYGVYAEVTADNLQDDETAATMF